MIRPALFVLSSLAFAAPAAATVALRVDVAELASEAVFVVHAEVVDRYVVQERGAHGEIYTRAVLQVRRYLKGEGPERVVVQQLGGRLGELELRVTGNARLEPGDEVVAFLDVDPERQLAFVVGLAQGVFQVRRGVGEVTVWRELGGLAFYSAGAVAYATDPQAPSLRSLDEAVGRAAPVAPSGGEEVSR